MSSKLRPSTLYTSQQQVKRFPKRKSDVEIMFHQSMEKVCAIQTSHFRSTVYFAEVIVKKSKEKSRALAKKAFMFGQNESAHLPTICMYFVWMIFILYVIYTFIWLESVWNDIRHDFTRMTDMADDSVVLVQLLAASLFNN